MRQLDRRPALLDLVHGVRGQRAQPLIRLTQTGDFQAHRFVIWVEPRQIEEQSLYDRFKPFLDKKWYGVHTGLNSNDPQLRAALAVQPAACEA